MTRMTKKELRLLLEEKAGFYNHPSFIEPDPVSIPHLFSKKQDIEIAGFWAAILSWGQRVTIINKSKELFRLMDQAPHDFILNHTGNDLKRLLHFKHRTFNTTDTLYFVAFLRQFYRQHDTLEDAFLIDNHPDKDVENNLIAFHKLFFSLPDHPIRTRKHIATPQRNSACKRLNMFLRWMVRKDDRGVDFGLWTRLKPSQLICPCDLHVVRVARSLFLMSEKQVNWKAAKTLTHTLRKLDPVDPVKYDYALFGMGIMEGWGS